jgi:hypothetical protein
MIDIYICEGKSVRDVEVDEDNNYATPIVIELGQFQKKFGKALQDFTTRRTK